MSKLEHSPTVSVLITAYNGEEYIGDAIESILGQTFADFELIIVDDDSKDRTVEIANSYAQKDSRLKVIINKKNIGFTQSLNKGIEQSRGEYIARIDADDIAHPERLARQVEFMEQNESVSVVGTYCHWIDHDKKVIGELIPLMNEKDMRKKILGKCVAVHSSIMVRQALFDKIGLYDPRPVVEDELDLYARALKNGLKIANIPEFLMWRRTGGITIAKTGSLWPLRIRAKYLPSFFSLNNVFYTMVYGLLCILPESLRQAIYQWRNRDIFKKVNGSG